MVTALFAALAVVQAPSVVAGVDRQSVNVGDDITLTIEVEVTGSDPVQLIDQPSAPELQLRGTSQSSVVTFRNGVGVRSTTWEFQFRAVSGGRVRIDPIRVRIGNSEVETSAMIVEVTEVDPGARSAISDRVLSIVSRAPGPSGSGEVVVSVVPSRSSITLGEQLDLVVAAWFPRDVRARLRTRPTLTPPELQGAWSYPQTGTLGVVTTRDVRGRRYDLFVHHQIVFPLTAGPFVIGPATVTYSLPLRTSILSREVREEVQSPDVEITILPQPETGRPEGFGGAAASRFRLSVDVDSSSFSRGEVGTLVATLTGRGNVALWPEPKFEWPTGVRVYPGQTDVQIDDPDGPVSGTKTFSYLLLPDSIGSYLIPAVTFPYFDLDTKRFREVSSRPIRLISRRGRETRGPVASAPQLIPAKGAPMLIGLERRGVWFWLTVLCLPALMILGARVRPRERKSVTPVSRRVAWDANIGAIDREFRGALYTLVADAVSGDTEALTAALQAAGVETPVAVHAGHVRDRLRQAVYGPDGTGDTDELAEEVREVLRALPGAGRTRSDRRHRGGLFAALLTLVITGYASAQAPSAEQLFEAGSYALAADSLAARAVAAPDDPAHWANLGFALNASERPSEARAALIKWSRLQPRNREVRAALREAVPLDRLSQRMTWISPITPGETFAIAIGLWILGWVAIAMRQPRGVAIGLLLVAVVAVAAGFWTKTRYAEPIALIVRADTPLRDAPYGTAPAGQVLSQEIAVRIARTVGPWYLVERDQLRGWVLAEELRRL